MFYFPPQNDNPHSSNSWTETPGPGPLRLLLLFLAPRRNPEFGRYCKQVPYRLELSGLTPETQCKVSVQGAYPLLPAIIPGVDYVTWGVSLFIIKKT